MKGEARRLCLLKVAEPIVAQVQKYSLVQPGPNGYTEEGRRMLSAGCMAGPLPEPMFMWRDMHATCAVHWFQRLVHGPDVDHAAAGAIAQVGHTMRAAASPRNAPAEEVKKLVPQETCRAVNAMWRRARRDLARCYAPSRWWQVVERIPCLRQRHTQAEIG